MTSRRSALHCVLIYAIGSALWIVMSDWVLGLLVHDQAAFSQASVLKGLLFVALTSVLLYGVLRGAQGEESAADAGTAVDGNTASLWASLGIAALVMIPLTVGVLWLNLLQERRQEAARVEAIAQSRSAQVSRWFQRLQFEAASLATYVPLSEIYARWRDHGDTVAGEQFMQALVGFRKANLYEDVMLLDARGDVVAAEHSETGAVPAELRRVAFEVATTGRPGHTAPYPLTSGSPGQAPRFAIVVPLPNSQQWGQAVIALRVDPQEFLMPSLHSWPVPSKSGVSMLVRRVGEQVVEYYGTNPVPLVAPNILSARVIRGDAPEGVAIDATDYRGVSVLGVVQRVAGTDWYLVARVDRAEILAGAMNDSIWIVVAGLMATLAAGGIMQFRRDRQNLRMAKMLADQNAAATKALNLLNAIAEGSTDAIFAKDREGRYVVFNQYACHLTGKSYADVIGRDDTTLFSPDEATALMASDTRVMADERVQTYEETLTTAKGRLTFLTTKGPMRDEHGAIVGTFGISRDVTDRRRADEAIRESAARYRTLFSNMLSGFAHCRIIFDGDEPVDWEYIAVNEAFERLTGLKDIAGRRVSAAIPGELERNPELLEAYAGTAVSGEPRRIESYIHSLGLWLSINVYRPAHGEFVAVFEDVSTRKVAENLLGESQRRLTLALDAANMGVWEWNFETQCLYCLPEAWDVFGIPATDSGLTALQIGAFLKRVHPNDRERLHATVYTGIARMSMATEEFRMQLPDGGWRWVMAVGRAESGVAGAPSRGLGVVLDIDARKRAEQALARSADLIHAVSNSLLAHIVVLDRGGVIVSANQAWTRFSADNSDTPGTPAAHTGVGANYLDVCRDANGQVLPAAEAAYRGIIGVLDGEMPSFTLEYSCHSPTSERWFLMSVTPLAHVAGGVVITHFDISERVLAENALRHSKVRYRTMIDSLSEGVIVVDREGNVHQRNPSAERILNLANASALDPGFLFSSQLPLYPDGMTVSAEELPVARTLATGKPQRDVHLGVLLPNDSIAWLLINSEPIVDAVTGELQGAIVSFTDITARFANERQLEKLSLAVEQSPESVVITDLAGRIEYVNEAFVQNSGYRRDEALGRNPRLLQSGSTPADTYRSLWEALKAGKTWHGEFENRRKNGERYVEIAHIAPVRSSGRTTHYVAIKEDVTKRKLLEQELEGHRHHLESLVADRTHELRTSNRALADAEEFAKAVAENLPGGIAYWDRELRCRFANSVYQHWFRFQPFQWLGKTYSDLMGESMVKLNESHIRGALAGTPQSFERTLTDGRGEKLQLRVQYVPDRYGNDVRGLFVQITDITAEQLAEANLQHLNEALVLARDRAESGSRAKSAFLANMSHEIRTPMNAIVGLTHLLHRDNGNPAQRQRLGKILTATNHLMQVINDILDLSKIESGRMSIEVIDFTLDSLLSGMLELVAERARAKGLEVVIDTAGLPDRMRGDPTRLSQALINLLGNAVKFTERGSVTVRGEVLDESTESLRIRFVVRDTGIGIPADKISNLFNAFEQADSSTTRRFGGTGLGLAITRRLAELMGGEAGVVSEVGVGSTFWFTACVAHPETAADARGAASEQGTRTPGAEEILRRDYAGARVLLAEDDPVNQEVAGDLLRGVGLTVDVAATGAQAVAMACNRAYELILMDLQMPQMDGIAATRALRALAALDGVAILAMTATALDEDRVACLDAGMNDLVAKPIDPATFFSILLKWLPMRAPLPFAEGPPDGPPTESSLSPPAHRTAIDGLDAAAGLARVGGKQDAYLRLLDRFAGHYADGIGDLDADLAAGRLDGARMFAHSLKGASGAVGAMRVMQLASTLEAAIVAKASQPELALQSSRLHDELTALVAALRGSCAAVMSTPAAPTASDLADSDVLLDRLDALLDAADFGAAAAFRDVSPVLRAMFVGRVGNLERLVNAYDFSAALVELRALRGRVAA
jgi:two-component system sensor histidine kinase/response regulator